MTSAQWVMRVRHIPLHDTQNREVNSERGGQGIQEMVDPTHVSSREIPEVRCMANLQNGIGGHRVPEVPATALPKFRIWITTRKRRDTQPYISRYSNQHIKSTDLLRRRWHH